MNAAASSHFFNASRSELRVTTTDAQAASKFSLSLREDTGNSLHLTLSLSQWIDVHHELTAALTAADRAAEVAA